MNDGLRQGGLDLEASAAAGSIMVEAKSTDKPAAKLPSNDTAVGLAYAIDATATASGGKISADTALKMLRRAGLVEEEPAEPEPARFNWTISENREVILPEQRSTAVLVNYEGAAVIRQNNPDLDNPDDGGEDAFVIVQHKNLPELIAALTEIAKAPCRRVVPRKSE